MKNCGGCGQVGATKCCTGCRESWYCNVACQRKAWKAGHKNKCVQAVERSSSSSSSGGATLLLLRLLLLLLLLARPRVGRRRARVRRARLDVDQQRRELLLRQPARARLRDRAQHLAQRHRRLAAPEGERLADGVERHLVVVQPTSREVRGKQVGRQ